MDLARSWELEWIMYLWRDTLVCTVFGEIDAENLQRLNRALYLDSKFGGYDNENDTTIN